MTVEFDRFHNTTVAKLIELPLVPAPGKAMTSALQMSAFVRMPGEHPSPPPTVTLMISTSSSDWQYLRCHSLTLLVDGHSMDVETTHDGEVQTGYVIEVVDFTLPVQSFLQMASAQTVEGKLCNTEFALGLQGTVALRDLASRMK